MVDMLPEGIGEEQPSSSMAELMGEEYDFRRPRRGDIRKGTIVRIDKDTIIVDIGGKRDGIVPSRDLDRLGPEVVAKIRVGDEVRVYIMHPETRDGDTIVSLNLARQAMDWDRAQKLMDSEEVFEGEVSGYNKGGLIVPFGRLQGFVPASQIANLNGRIEGGSHLERLAQLVGKTLPLKVIEVSRHRRRLILSERAAQREWRAQQREKLFEDIEEGETRQGVVSNLCDFGAFVDLGGADGLIHISELAWNRVKHPREVLNIGQEVEVFVLKIDLERQRIALSLKRLQADPWRMVEEKYYVGQIVMGTITNIVKFGAFAEIEPGIEGLIHLSELVEGGTQEPSEVVFEGEKLALQVVTIDSARQRMGLSLRRVPPEQRFPRAEEESPEAVIEAEAEQAEGEEASGQAVAGLGEIPSEGIPQVAEKEIVAASLLEVDETSPEEALDAAVVEAGESDAGQVPEEEEEGPSLATDDAVAEETEAETVPVPEDKEGEPSPTAKAEVDEASEPEQVPEEEEEGPSLVTDDAVTEEIEAEEGPSLATDDAVAEETEAETEQVPEEEEEGPSLATDDAVAEETEAETEQVPEEEEEGPSLATDDAVAEEIETGTGEVPENQGDGESGS